MSKKAALKFAISNLFGSTEGVDNFTTPTKVTSVGKATPQGVSTLEKDHFPAPTVDTPDIKQSTTEKNLVSREERELSRIATFRDLQNIAKTRKILPLSVKEVTPEYFVDDLKDLRIKGVTYEFCQKVIQKHFPDTKDTNLDNRRASLLQIVVGATRIQGGRYYITEHHKEGHILIDPYGYATNNEGMTFRGNIYKFPKETYLQVIRTKDLEGKFKPTGVSLIDRGSGEETTIINPNQPLNLKGVKHFGAENYTRGSSDKSKGIWGYPMLRIGGEGGDWTECLRIHTIIAALTIGVYPALISMGNKGQRVSDIHHIKSFHQTLDNSPSNISILWTYQHERLHNTKRWLYKTKGGRR